MTNDMKTTPLMLAIQYGKSLETVKLLLTDSHVVQSVNHAVDSYGNTAMLYACGINKIDILKALIHVAGEDLDQHINAITGDSVLHVASRNGCSVEFMKYIMDHCQHQDTKNKKMETFYHSCRNVEFLKRVLLDEKYNVMSDLIQDVDETGRSPLMTWALKGRLDLVELVVSNNANCNDKTNYARVDKYGNTVLHLLAMHTGKGLTYGDKSLDYMIEQFKDLVNIREWVHGNTPLHLTAETSILASAHNVSNAILFTKALVRHGAAMDAVNYRDEHPVNICKIPELTICLDGMCFQLYPLLY